MNNIITETNINNDEALISMYNLDYESLKIFIDNGFSINSFFEDNNGYIQNVNMPIKIRAPIIHIIKKNWIQGWKLLVKNFPRDLIYQEKGEFPIFWEIASQNYQYQILSSLVILGIDPLCRDNNGRNSIHLLFDSFRKYKDYNSDNLIYCIKWFAGKNIDIYEKHPGFYEENDIYKNGHNLWTYSIMQNAWEIAFKTLPKNWENVIKSPRWKESIIYLKKSLLLTSKKEEVDIIKKIILLWEERFLLESFLYLKEYDFTKEQIISLIILHKKDKNITNQLWKYFSKNISDYDLWFVINQKPIENIKIYELLIETGYDYKADWMIDYYNNRSVENFLFNLEGININSEEYFIFKKILIPFIDYKDAQKDENSFDNKNISSQIKEKFN